MKYSIRCGQWALKSRSLLGFFSDRIVKSAFNVSIGTFRENIFSNLLKRFRTWSESFGEKNWKSYFFFVFFGICREFFWPFAEFSSGVCENCLLLVHVTTLNKKFFWRKNLYSIIFAQRANSSGVLLERFRRDSEKCFIGVQKNILGGKVCEKSISSFTVFRTCAKTVGPSDKFLWQVWVWKFFTCP